MAGSTGTIPLECVRRNRFIAPLGEADGAMLMGQ